MTSRTRPPGSASAQHPPRRPPPRLGVPVAVPLRYAYSLERARRELDFTNRPPRAAFEAMLGRVR